MSRPDITVVIPCYRQAHLLPNALGSVFSGSPPSLEVIVVDDGSPDDVRTALGTTKRLRYIRQENRGVSAARNTGYRASTAAIIHFLDSDDAIAPDLYEIGFRALRRHSEWDVATVGTRFMFPDGTLSAMHYDPPFLTGRVFERLCRNPVLVPGCFLFRRSILERTALFDETLKCAEDWDLCVQVARTGAVFGRIASPLYLYRVNPAGMSHDVFSMYDASMEVLRRAHSPDPRVIDPFPDFARGAPREQLATGILVQELACLGRALTVRDLDASARIVRRIVEIRGGIPLEEGQCNAVYRTVAISSCIIPPRHREARAVCWPTLIELATQVKDDPPAAEVVRDITAAFFDKGPANAKEWLKRIHSYDVLRKVYRAARWKILKYAV